MLRALSILIVVAACDSRATASDPQATGGGRAEQKSNEYETCGASLHCQDELRCFDHVCRRATRSPIGDYQAALGAQLRARGELDAAIAAYAASLGYYGEKVPPDVACAYGAVLAQARAKNDNGELAARVLHRCLLAVPGGPLHEDALVNLALLADAGLDPGLLNSTKLADKYLTKGPTRPAADKLKVTVTGPSLSSRVAPALQQKLGEGEPRTGFIACWTAYNEASKKDTLAVTLGARAAYVDSEEFEDVRSFLVKLDAAPTGATPDDVATACVRKVLEISLKAAKESFSSKLTITVN
ncbi:MAG: hypothetical protein WKG01_30115 [Kofleriaceae bacterium]